MDISDNQATAYFIIYRFRGLREVSRYNPTPERLGGGREGSAPYRGLKRDVPASELSCNQI